MKPTTMAAHGSIRAHPAVIQTRPPRQPFMAKLRLKVASPVLRSTYIRLAKRAATPPDAAARVVLTPARAAVSDAAALVISPVEPTLKPYQPNHRMKDPSTCEKNHLR